ncbi:AMP-binding protein [Spirochaetia bacterium]|nr:AMP-binding protein [Spirochaetia bacterium]
MELLRINATFARGSGQNNVIQLNEMTLAELCLRASAKYHKRLAFELFRDRKTCRPVSYGLLGIRAGQIASILKQLGIGAGDRVLLLSENRPEWPLAYFGIALAGAVSVPVLPGFAAEQIRHICKHAGVSAICVSRALETKIKGIEPNVPLIFVDDIHDTTTGNATADAIDGQFPQRTADDLASIVYTSGTQGNSKGVMLSHRNLIYCAQASRALMPIYPRDRLLSVLPLAHTYECSLGLLTALMNGAKISYLDRPPSPSVLIPAAQALRPTCMVTVPLLIEKIYRQEIAPALKKNPLYRCALTRPLALQAAGRKLNSALGGSIRFFGLGGAPLSAEVEDFLRSSRFPYAPGYGLTETAPLVAGTAPYCFPRRSAGSILRGLALRITKEGEIQVRGPNVMMGYYNDEEKTREAFTPDGWLHTGDLGCIDRQGRLYIQGRLKALILGPSGENIYPEEIEGLLSASNLVEDALVYPGEKGELVALVHISESARAAAQSTAQAVVNALEELRQWANKKLANFSRLSRIEVRDEPFEKTPTLKIKRYLYGNTIN